MTEDSFGITPTELDRIKAAESTTEVARTVLSPAFPSGVDPSDFDPREPSTLHSQLYHYEGTTWQLVPEWEDRYGVESLKPGLYIGRSIKWTPFYEGGDPPSIMDHRFIRYVPEGEEVEPITIGVYAFHPSDTENQVFGPTLCIGLGVAARRFYRDKDGALRSSNDHSAVSDVDVLAVWNALGTYVFPEIDAWLGIDSTIPEPTSLEL